MSAAVATKPATASNISRIGGVKKGRLRAPLRIIFYGTEGVGKSTLAANAPDPVWLDIEDGSGRLEVARYPFRDEPGGHVPRTYAEVTAAIDDLTRNPHDFKTLVVDTVDRLESLIWRHMIDRDNPKVNGKLDSIESYGFGKGYTAAVDEWRSFAAKLDHLRVTRNVSVILLAHAHVKVFKSPDSDDYERYNLQINAQAAGFLKSWADVVGFCRFDEGAGKTPGQTRVKGWSTGRRMLNLVRTAAYDAKGRGGMPAELELEAVNPWAPFGKAIEDAESLGAVDLQKLIEIETVRLGDADLTAKVTAAVVAAVAKGDTETLNRYLQDLKRREPKAVA